MLFKKTVLSLLAAGLLCPAAYAWEANLPDSALDKSLIIVDKGKREFFYLEKNGEKITRLHYPSIHGEIEGDKQTEGDLKTPEGVYFVRGKIQVPLDFEMYGDHAYALNYPNPIDRLRGKTGGGIWIHSKGEPIKGQVTQGCVAIDLEHIKTLDTYLKPGTPVIIAQGVHSGFHKEKMLEAEAEEQKTEAPKPAPNNTEISAENNIFIVNDEEGIVAEEKAEPKVRSEEPEHQSYQTPIYVPEPVKPSKNEETVRQLTLDWNRAWADRSEKFFDFYDKDAYSKTSGSFEKFRTQKEGLFGSLSWIYIAVDDVEILEGNDYFVSWFKQYYLAPNHKTEGIRRLYWMKDGSGQYKVVAMEWMPKQVGLEHILEEKMEKEIPLFLENWRLAWESANIDDYMSYYGENAVQDSRRGIEAIRGQKQYIWDLKKPKKVAFSNVSINLEKEGVVVRMEQDYEDMAGYSDKGIKTLILHPKGDKWVIYKESWRNR